MTFNDAMNFISNRSRFKSSLSLSSLKKLMSLCGNPQSDMSFIHIAGTNGKGSVSYMLSNILQSAGYKTGLFVSPYVVDFCERIQINGNYIEKSHFADIIKDLKPKVESLEKQGHEFTEFDLITAAALIYFKNSNCDYVVLEVGMGGRFDATNIIDAPLVSAICHIDLDHQAILGDSIEKIAQEKCGIIKPSTRYCVSYPMQQTKALQVIEQNAAKNNVALVIPNVQDKSIAKFSSTATVDNIVVEISMAGEHQVYNASMAVTIARLLNIENEHIKNGIKNTTVPARVEIISKTPLVVLDGAHNTDGICALANYIKSNINIPVTLIIGMVNDKDYKGSVKLLSGVCQRVITVNIKSDRALKQNELYNEFKRYIDDVTVANDTDHALALIEQKNSEGALIICGSLYLASDIRQKVISLFKK